MKNYFKKFSIMFVMALAIIGFGAMHNGSIANAATVGQQLTSAESGWTRYDDTDGKIIYNGNWLLFSDSNYYISSTKYSTTIGDKIKVKFVGTKLRLVGTKWSGGEKNVNVIVDGVSHSFTEYNTTTLYQYVLFEELNLSNIQHEVEITVTTGAQINFDAIDIDDTGYLVDGNSPASTISLDKTSMDLAKGDSKQLTATTTPTGLDVEWSADNTGIATVEQDGTIKGISVGTATITAKIKGTEITATCIVTIAPNGENPPQVDPPTGDANLFIELVDGNIKSYSVSSDEITKFKQWYLDRDNTTSNKPYYEFTKGTYKDYVIHDKIDWFEVR